MCKTLQTQVAAVLEALGTAYHSTGDNSLAKIKLERAVGILSLLPAPTADQVTTTTLIPGLFPDKLLLCTNPCCHGKGGHAIDIYKPASLCKKGGIPT